MGNGTTTFDDLLSVTEGAAPHPLMATIPETEQSPPQQTRPHARFIFAEQESQAATVWGVQILIASEVVQSPAAQKYVVSSSRLKAVPGPEQELDIVVKMQPRKSRATLVKIVGRVKPGPNPMF